MATTRPSTAARRYAEALWELATRDGAVDAYAAGLDEAASTLAEPGIIGLLRNPAKPLRDRTELVDRLLAGRVPNPVLRTVGLLVGRGRIDRLPAVAAEFRRLYNRERGIVVALATAAAPLTDGETEALRQKVAQMTDRTVDLRVQVDEALIGGLTVRVGDTLYDASVRGRLERLRERLVTSSR